MASEGAFEVVVDRGEVPGVRLYLAPRGGGDVLRLHLAQRDPVDVLHTGLGQRRDRRVDRVVESDRVPERVVVARGDHDVVTGAEQVRLDVTARQVADEHGRLADDRHVPVGGEERREDTSCPEPDRVGHEHHALVARRDGADGLGRSGCHADEHRAGEHRRDQCGPTPAETCRHGTHQPVVSNSVWPVEEVRKQRRPVSLMPMVIEFATTAPAPALADDVGASPVQASALTNPRLIGRTMVTVPVTA